MDLLDRIVLSNFTHEGVSGANGLSIYSPSTHEESIDASYREANWSKETAWDDMLLTVFSIE